MNLETIKAAVLNGQTVCWSTTDYVVKYHERGGFNIVYTPDGNCIGLTHQDDITLNGKESEFFMPVKYKWLLKIKLIAPSINYFV